MTYASLNEHQREIVDASRILLVEYLHRTWESIEDGNHDNAVYYLGKFDESLKDADYMNDYFPEITKERLKRFADRLEERAKMI